MWYYLNVGHYDFYRVMIPNLGSTLESPEEF